MKIVKHNIVILSSDVLCATLFFLASVLLLSTSANAQGYRVDGVTQARSGFPAPAVTIAVCTEPATITTTPCSALATLYTDSTLATACTGILQPPPATSGGAASSCSNPLVADGLGNYHYYVRPGRYALQFYGSGITTYAQRDQVYPCDSTSTCSIFNNIQYVGGAISGDIGAQINSAIASSACPATGCEIHVPITSTGNYNFSTQISFTKQIKLVCDGTSAINNAGTGGAITTLTWTGGASAAVLISGAAATGSEMHNCNINNTGAGTVAVDVDNSANYVKLVKVTSIVPAVKWSVATFRGGNTAAIVFPDFEDTTSRNAAPIDYDYVNVTWHGTCNRCNGYGATTASIVLGTATKFASGLHFNNGNFAPATGVTAVLVVRAQEIEFAGPYSEIFGSATAYFLDCPATSSLCQAISVKDGFLSETDTNPIAAMHSGLASADISMVRNFLNGNNTGFAIAKNDASAQITLDSNYNNQGASTQEVVGTAGYAGVVTRNNYLTSGLQPSTFPAGLSSTEIAAPAGVAGRDFIYGDSTAHRLKANNNNGGAVTVPYLETSDAWTGLGNFVGNTVALTADWTCGTAGTVASCVAAQIIGSGGGVPLTFTLPLAARSYTLECDGVVGQATAATANQWNLLTATNGATNVTANYSMATAATASAFGAVTNQASTTTTFQITPSWTLGGTATKMPFHIWAKIEGASVSGTVVSLQLVAPTVGDLVTIYRGAACRVF